MTALRLLQAGLDVKVCEASRRIGGRVHSVYTEDKDYLADLGPTWIWPAYQTSVQRVLSEFNLPLMDQYDEGPAVVERFGGHPPVRHNLPGQHGISRLSGGPQSLVTALRETLHTDTITTGIQIVGLTDHKDHIEVDALTSTGQHTLQAETVVVATPLRIAEESITFSPVLSDKQRQLMKVSPTWMSAQAKAVVVYQHAFWRNEGLSGRIASQTGPLVEVHDHSGRDGVPAALFGFIGVTATDRDKHRDQLPAAIIEQLVRCFGDEAAKPDNVTIEDWALNPFICTQEDRDEIPQHPGVLPETIRQGSWNNRLFFTVAETSAASPGLIDGALDAGSRTAELIVANRAV